MITKLVVCGIKAYQRIGPFLFLKTCRFVPSCSSYAIEAIEKKGLVKGIGLALRRICRCHPFTPLTHDPVR